MAPPASTKYLAEIQKRAPPQGGHTNASNSVTGIVRFQLGGVAIQVHADVRGIPKLVSVFFPEVPLHTELGRLLHQALKEGAKNGRAELPQPVIAVILNRPDRAELVCALVVRIEVRAPQRPPAMRQPGPFLQIERIEKCTFPAKMVRRTAEIASPRGVQAEVIAADVKPVI